MSKISTYEVAPVPKLSDKLIGTSVGGEIEDITYNFTLLELLELFLPIIPANNLQGVLDYGNTATQDINLFGTITTTNLDVTDTANLFITYLNEETHLVGSLFDSTDSVGTAGQVLTSTGDGVEWFTLPPIFTPNLEQVLTEGNTSSIDILLDANLEALDVSADTATVGVNLTLGGTITDNNAAVGSAGQVLSSTVTGVAWVSLPVYSATSPLLFNSATGVFSIQVANSTQDGYLTANDWVTFDGKQNAGAYITALTGEATATGPGSVPITLNNASVTAKVLTGLNVTGGSISASDSILTAFGKVQSQINGLMGGVQYQGVWDAATNTPTLTSSVGTQGHYYIVNVAGNTDLNGITDWKVGDWAIFSGGTWQKVDNTESVTSVNGQTGAVSLTTDNIPEGATNLYYLDSRARAALSFAAGSGAYNSLTGVITIPTNNNQILNGANYITLSSISATSPLAYNNLTGVFSIQQADATQNGYLSSTDWSTFNNKQNYLGGTGLVKSTAGTITYITDNSGNWNTAYNRSIVSAAVTGTTTKTLTLNEQDGNTITASWTDLDTGLTSVGVSMPSAFSVANSPLTANGTIAVTGAGTTLQYIDGTGALQTFPGLTGFVPYTGATQNVNLGTYGLLSDYLQLNTTPSSVPTTAGTMAWNNTDGTLDIRLKGGNVTLQVGEETVVRVVNKSGVDLLEANYQVVRVRNEAEGGAQGQRLAVVLARANTKVNHTGLLGIVTETINSNQEGFVTNFGIVRDIDTTGDLQGETWADGDVLWLSETTAGALTNVEPTTHPVQIGYVTYAHQNNGKIFVYLQEGVDELDELHDVSITGVTNNQGLFYDSATSLWKNKSIATVLGYTPANDALVVHLAGTETITGQKTFTNSLIGNTITLDGSASFSASLSLKQSGLGILASTGYATLASLSAGNLEIYFGDTNLYAVELNNSLLTASRQYKFPDANGTLALIGGAGVGTVTSVAALTLGTSGTDLSSTVANPTTTPVITLNVPTASAANRGALSAADWSTFNTKVGSVTASSPLASSGGSTPNITIQQSSGSQDGYLSSTDWTTFNNKQAAGNYITSLTGEATGTGPGATAVTLNNASVTAKVLTGINITGGTVQATDTMLTAFGKLQNQINGLVGGSIYQGTWNAATNTPALASGVGTKGYYYIVSVAGTTNLDGITDWFVGDWAIFDGTAWQQVDNTDAVVSVNGQTGAVSLTTDNIPEGVTNQYFLNSRARAALSFTAGSGAYNSTTGVITIPTNTSQLTNGANFITLASLSGTAPIQYNNTTGAISITQAGTASNGYLSSTDWNTFNNKQPAGSYVTLTGVETLSNKTFSNVINLSVNGFILAGVTGVNPLQMYSTTLTSNFLFSSNSFGTNINNDLFYSKDSNNKSVLSFNNTAERTYTFPNASGTIALTSDIPVLTGYVTIDTAQTITGKKTFSNTFGDGDPILVLTGTGSGVFQYATTAYNASLSAGQTIAHFVGRASSSKNSAYIGYQYAGSGSDSNFLSLGIWGFDHLLKIYPTGAATLSGAFTASVAALSTASNAFVVSDSGTLKYRTAAQVLSDIGGQAALTNPVTGTGASGRVAYWSSTSAITSEADFVWDATNNRLGIGTDTPASSIHVIETTAARMRLQTGATGAALLDFLNGSVARWSIGIDNNQAFGKLENRVLAVDAIRFYDASNDLSIVPTNGIVGIGKIASGSIKLQVANSITGVQVMSLQNTSASGYSGAHLLDSAGTAIGHFGYANISTSAPLTDKVFFGSITNKDVVLTQNDVVRFTLSSTNASFTGILSASNFSGSSSGTNTGDQTLQTVTDLGATTTNAITINKNTTGLIFNRTAVTNYCGTYYRTNGANQWFIGMRENLSSNNFIFYSETSAIDVLTANVGNGNVTVYGSVLTGAAFVSSGSLSVADISANKTFIDNASGARMLSYGPNSSTRGTISLFQSTSTNTLGQYALTIDASGNSVFIGTISASNFSGTSSGTNTGDQTLAGLGGVPTSRTLTINGVGYDLSANRSWTVSSSQWTTSGTAIYYDAGNVGVYTTSTYSPLTVGGRGVSWGESATIYPASNGYITIALRLEGADTTTGTWAFGKQSKSSEGYTVEYMQFAKNGLTGGLLHRADVVQSFDPANGNALFGFNMGIGTITPNAKLDVRGRQFVGSGTSTYVPTTGTSLIAREVGDTFIGVHNSGYGVMVMGWDNSEDRGVIGVDSSQDIAFITDMSVTDGADNIVGKVPKVIIKGGGNVGINTITPVNLLQIVSGVNQDDVVGTVQTYYNGTNPAFNSGFTSKNYSGTSQFMQWTIYGLRIGSRILTNSGQGGIYFTYANDEVGMTLSGTGNIGIGGTPLQALDRTTTSYGSFISNPTGTGGNYNENFRANRAGNGYSAINMGGANGTTSGTGVGIWTLVCPPVGEAYRFYFDYNAVDVVSFSTAGAVTARGGFFEYSDSRLKQLIKDDYKAIGIENVKAKLYIKDGKEEVGYFAQDIQGVLSSAVSVNDAGFLSLSYTQVHTAKIAIIEDEVDVLKKEVAELKVKLQKYEA